MNKRKTNRYSTEFKESSAKLAVESDQHISLTAKELGVHLTTLHSWVAKYHPKNSFMNNAMRNESELELKKLKKEFKRVKEERDILKKAAAYFASHPS